VRVRAAAALLATLPLATGILGQEVIPDRVTCDDCVVTVDSLAVFGSLDDPFSPSPLSDIAGDGRTFLVGPLEGMPDAVAVYSLAGDGRLLATSGDGPGEFRRVSHLEFKDKHFHVFSRGRETVYSADLRLLQTHRLPTPTPMDAVVVSPDKSIVEFIGVQDRGPAFLLSLRHGSDHETFGSGIRLPPNAKNHLGYRRVLGQGMGETFWSALNNRYAFSRWSPEEIRPVQQLRFVADWFPESQRQPEKIIDPFKEPPPSVITALREHDDGRLWVASIHASEDWRPMEVEVGFGEGLSLYPTIVYTIVDLIDTQTGISHARVRFPGIVVSFPAPGLVAIKQTGQFGLTTFKVVRIHVKEGLE
jgi:hypothetical protein